jgi:hypothetical protein
MLSETQKLPVGPAELRLAAEGLISLVKSQALRIAKLEHQLAGLRRHRFGSTSESLDQLQLRLEDEEIAAAEAVEAVPPACRRGCRSASRCRRIFHARRPCSRPAMPVERAAAS